METKIVRLEENGTAWIYHSGPALYLERFTGGRLLAAQLRCSNIALERGQEETGCPAFDFQLDGETMSFGWETGGSAVTEKDGVSSLRMILKHSLRPLELEIETDCCGEGFFRRRIKLSNMSKTQSFGLGAAAPLSGSLWRMADGLDRVFENLAESGVPPYSVGRMRDSEWGCEGNFQWDDVPPGAELLFGSESGRSGHSTPFAVVRNNVHGGYLTLSLAWSANWKMRFKSENLRGGVNLKFSLSPAAPCPMRVIEPGETVAFPETHFGLNPHSFDSMIQCWHSHLRKNVLPVAGYGRQPVIYNHWGYLQHELGEDALKREIDVAAEAGAELFMVDAGWYADAQTAWNQTTGDWKCGGRLPNDLHPVFNYARAKGLMCGLWAEVESAGKDSQLAKEHPDWFISRYGGTVGRILDLTKPAVAAYVEETVFRLIESYKLDMFRLDYNVSPAEGGFNERGGRLENTLWRHTEVIHGIFRKVRKKYPSLQLENCAGGGGRTDLGMMGLFTTTWVSDWQKMPRTIRILNGMSMALPPEYVSKMFGVCQQAAYHGSSETLIQMAVMGHPVISGLGIGGLSGVSPNLMEMTRKYIGIYKNFIRPFHRGAKVYHHTPVIPGFDSSGYCALEYVSEDRSKAAACVFRLVNAPGPEYLFRFRGLDTGREYSLTMEPGTGKTTADGLTLSTRGIPLTLDCPLSSAMILAETAE
jgi:alpha-galactosidase